MTGVMKIFCFALILAVLPSYGRAADQCQNVFLDASLPAAFREAILTNPNENKYIQDRSFFSAIEDKGKGIDVQKSYEGALGEEFVKDVFDLSPQAVWLDGGAGSFSAQAQYVKSKRKNHGVPAKIIGIVDRISKETRALVTLTQELNEVSFQPVIGQRVEDVQSIPADSVDVISDVYGAYSYSQRPDLVLKRYLSWSKVGGRIYIAQSPPPRTYRGEDVSRSYSMFIHRVTTEIKKSSFLGVIDTTETITSEEGQGPFTLWYEKIKGIRFQIKSGQIYIEKISDDIQIPELDSVSQDNRAPPIRYFKIKNNFL